MKNAFFLLVIITFFPCSFDAVCAQSKGGRWQFENNGFDTADWDAVDNNGTLQGAASFGAVAPLSEGAAFLSLDSTDVYDFFLVPDGPDLDFTDENIGISMWVYPYFVRDDVHYLLNKGDQFTNPKTTNYSLRLSTSGNLEFLIRDASDQAQPIASSFTLPENQWTFIAIFYEFSEGKVYMWNDPSTAPVDTLDYAFSFFANGDPLAIGSWYRSDPGKPSVKDFEGRIDDVRIGKTIEQILPAGSSVRDGHRDPMPIVYSLEQNYPNPFNPRTRMRFSLARTERITLVVYDVHGRQVAELLNGEMKAGAHELYFDATGLPSGVYLYTLKTGNNSMSRKMTVLK